MTSLGPAHLEDRGRLASAKPFTMFCLFPVRLVHTVQDKTEPEISQSCKRVSNFTLPESLLLMEFYPDTKIQNS